MISSSQLTMTTWARAGLALLVALLTLQIAERVYLDVHVTFDEDAYVFQAGTFLDGRLTRPLPPIPRVFDHKMIIQCAEIGWVSRYVPGHSIWLMPGVALNRPRIMIALAAGLSFWFLSGCAMLMGAAWWSAAFFLYISPYFLFMHGTMLSHTSALAATALMLWGYLRWARERSRAGIVAAGLAWSFLFLTRTFTAAMLAAPFGLDALFQLAAGRRWDRRKLTDVGLFAATALVGPLLFLLYNRLVTGDGRLSTYIYYDSNHRLGFGPWSGHTPAIGLQMLWNNVRLLDQWLLGLRGTLPIFAVLLALGWQTRWSLLALGSILLIVFGHVFFWFEGVNTCGPFYYFETLPFFGLLLSLAWLRLRRWLKSRPVRCAALLAGLLLASNAGVFMLKKGRAIREELSYFARIHELIRSAPSHSIVAVTGVHPHFLVGHLRNPRGLNSDRLVVQSMGAYDFILARYFSDRQFLLLDGHGPAELQPMNFEGQLFRHTVRGSITAHQVGDSAPADSEDAWMRAADPEMGAGWLAYGQISFLPQGRFKAIYEVSISGVDENAPVRLDLAADRGAQIIAERVVSGGGPATEYELEFNSGGFRYVEPRVWYGGSGQVEFRRVRIEELPADSAAAPEPPRSYPPVPN